MECITLELSVTSLHFLMVSFLHVALENTSSCWFVKAGGLQNMGRVDPVVGLPSHNMFSLSIWANELELPHWILQSEAKSVTVCMAAMTTLDLRQ